MNKVTQDMFNELGDKQQGFIDPKLLADFKFGNQRGKRKAFASLVADVKQKNVITPVVIRAKDGDNTMLELISGHGRRDASIEAGLTEIPFIFRVVDDQTAFDMHMSENIEREDLGIVEKVHAYSCYLTQFRGDYDATASRLNIPVDKLRRLLELNKCAESVKDAITSDKISPSHGLVLAAFPKKIQEKNVERIIAEKWSVAELKKRTAKVKLPLNDAKFDTSACAMCEHNTVHQMDLLSGMDEGAMCANAKCYQAKTTEYVAQKKDELTEQYGTILLLSETSSDNRQTTTSDVVGKAQFENCQNCENYVTVLDDRVGHEEIVTENQCVNKVCFTSCESAHRIAMDEANKAIAQASETTKGAVNSNTSADSQSGATIAKTVNAPTKAPTLGNSMVNAYDDFATETALAHFKNDPNFIHSMLTGALISMVNDGNKSFDDAVAMCLTMSADQRNEKAMEIVSKNLSKKTTLKSSTMISLMKRCLIAKSEDTLPVLVEHWKPTKRNLDIYTIKQLSQLAVSAGVDNTLDTEKKGAFSKLMKSGKKVIVETLGNSAHDFSAFIPKSILRHVYPKNVLNEFTKKVGVNQQNTASTDDKPTTQNQTQQEEVTHD